MTLLVNDDHCENCQWFRPGGKSKAENRNQKGYCPFIRCVKNYGFTVEEEQK